MNASAFDPEWWAAPMLWLFLGILVTFLGTRVVTRRIRAGSAGLQNWSLGGVHIHHQVFGVLLMVGVGCLEFAYRPAFPWSALLGFLFGAGVALTLDEFALWIYLDDVYWAKEGRISLDAIFVALAVSGLFLLGLTPVDLDTQGLTAPGIVLALLKAGYLLGALVPFYIAVLKGKPIVAVIGLFVWIVAIVAAIRLAKPGSIWSRRRYPEGSRKRLRSEERFGVRYQARWNRLRDLIGGRPNPDT